MPIRRLTLIAVLLVALVAAGCGKSSSSSSSKSAGSTTAAGPGALSGEAKSAATGDIPDNQVFLTFKNAAGGYTMRYPEGWAQRGSGHDVTFQDKNNVVHVAVTAGAAPTPASVSAEVAKLKTSTPSFKAGTPQAVTIHGARAVKVTYTTVSQPNPVTGKRVTLTVDRYELARNGKVAVVDLGTPVGVDNVDAYRMMIASFRWA
jgi:hypothetical protein